MGGVQGEARDGVQGGIRGGVQGGVTFCMKFHEVAHSKLYITHH